MRIPTFNLFQQQMGFLSNQYQQSNEAARQIYTGRSLKNASDDPVRASRIQVVENYILELNSYTEGNLAVDNRTSLYKDVAKDSLTILKQVQTYIKQAQSDTNNDNNRQSMVSALQGLLGMMVNLANKKDSDSNYIFSGLNSQTPAYQLVGGQYQYQGTDDQVKINIDTNMSVIYGESGLQVFEAIKQGNGSYVINPNLSNSGSGTILNNSVDLAQYIPDDYTLSFVTNASGELAYQVIGQNTGQVLPPLPATLPANAIAYVAGTAINFNGINLEIEGAPQVGDSFNLVQSQNENVFDAMQDLISLFQMQTQGTANDAAAKAIFTQSLTQLANTFNNIFDHFTEYQAQLGTRSLTISSQIKNNEAAIKEQTIIWSNLGNTPFEDAVSSYQRILLNIQATQQTYVKLHDVLSNLVQSISR